MLENFRLRVFRAVASHLSFSRAAEELLLTQPAVTQQIRALEDQLGVSLFDRSGGRVSLTQAGAALLPFAEQSKDLSDRALSAIAALSGQESGELSVGASQTIGQYLLPGFVAGFLRLHPRIRVAVCSGNTEQMLEALLTRQIQLALIEGPEQRKDLQIVPFMEDQMVLVVPGGHEWAGQEIAPNDLVKQPLLTREFGSGSRRVVERALTRAGIRLKQLQIRMELDSTEGLLSAVEAGLGLAFVSRWAVRNQLALGTLSIARVEGLVLTRKLSVAHLPGPEPAGPAGLFRRFLLAESRSYVSQLQRRLGGAAAR